MFRRAAAVAVAVATAAMLGACGSSGGGTGGNPTSGSTTPGGSNGSSGSGAPSGGSTELPGKGKPPVVIGDKDFAEEYILGELYAQALQAKGYTVTVKSRIGSSELIDTALTSGQIDMYPEYTGVIYTELAKLGDRPESAEATYDGAKQWENGRGFAVLDPTPFQDANGIAVLKSFADEHGLKTVGDLAKLDSFTFGGPPEAATRYQGVVGMKEAYGINGVQFKPLAIGAQYQALDSKAVDSIAIFTTDAQLASGKYTALTDTKGIFGYQQVVPVVKQTVLDEQGPEFTATLNAVSALLTTDAIVSMNKAVQIDQKDPADVARQFLQANGLA
jgi:osmoprotectant transport system substrate-binding protein